MLATQSPIALYRRFKSEGVVFWIQADQLCYRSTLRPLQSDELAELKQRKADIMGLVQRDELRNELALLQTMYQACLNVRKSQEYRKFSETTLHYENLAFARMEKRMIEIQTCL